MTNEMPQRFAVIIVGGGPAGISAAMGFLEARVECLLIDKGVELGGQVLDIPSYIANLPAGQFKNGKELGHALQSALGRAQELAALADSSRANGKGNYKSLMTVQKECRVLAIEPQDDKIVVHTNIDTYIGDYALVATGYRVKTLDAPEGSRFTKHWHTDTDTLPQDLSQVSLAVVGGGDSAVLKAIGLAERAKQVHLVVRSQAFKSRPDLVKEAENLGNCQIHLGFEIVALEGDESLKTVVLKDRARGIKNIIEASEVLVKVGYEPNTELLQNKVQLTPSRHVIASPITATSHPRLYAAGDIASELHPRIANAIGQGMMASGAIIERIFAARRNL
jgi:thioredoxin reductase